MATLVRDEVIYFDDERHFAEGLCWCGAEHAEEDGEKVLVHKLSFNKGQTVSDKDYQA